MSRVHVIACIHFCVTGNVLVTNQPKAAVCRGPCALCSLGCRAQAPFNHDFSLALHREGRPAGEADGIIGWCAAAARTRGFCFLTLLNPI